MAEFTISLITICNKNKRFLLEHYFVNDTKLEKINEYHLDKLLDNILNK